jgi:UDP-glucose 4-epimerase
MSTQQTKYRGNCLILGGCGFMGSHVAEGLLEAGYRVRIFDKINVATRNVDHILRYIELYEGDFTNEEAVNEAVQGVDYIFHFVGTTLPKTSTDNPVYDVESNVVSTLKLLDVAATSKVKKIIFSSSGGTVYGIPQSIPIAEDHPTDPTCSYGITKLAVEKYLELYRRTKRLDYLCFRIANPYGERQNVHSIQGVIAVFLGLVKGGKPLTIWGSGEITRDYIYIKDIVSVLVRALEIAPDWNVFNLGSGTGTSLNQLVSVIKEVTQEDIAVTYTEGRSIDVPSNVLDISRVKEAFGFTPSTSLPEGIKRTWDWLTQF